MDKPKFPDNEASRIKNLHSLNILDTSPEERFDRLTRMAKNMFNVPIVLISLIDENRQWFKSCIGLDVKQSARDISFCGHAILDHRLLMVPDATKDKRFVDNPLVTGEPYIRFYAGVPLNYLDCSKLGTLCIIDTKPRELDELQKDILFDLAATVERELSIIKKSLD